MRKNHREQRTPLELAVHLKDFSLTNELDERSWNLSRGGAFIKMAVPFEASTLVKFEMQAPGDKTITGVGKVAWQRPTGDDDGIPSGIGLKFVKLSNESELILDELLASLHIDVEVTEPVTIEETTTEPEDRGDTQETDAVSVASGDDEAQERLASPKAETEGAPGTEKTDITRSRSRVPSGIWLLIIIALIGLIWFIANTTDIAARYHDLVQGFADGK